MRRIVVSEFVTLDGVMESPGEEGELDGRGGWTFPYWSSEAEDYKREELFAADALLIGRKTYQLFAASWPDMTDETGFAEQMNLLPKYVASTTLTDLSWKNSKLIQGNLVEEIGLLKQVPGQNILVAGSADLLRTLMQHKLVDEYRLMIFPVVLGRGKQLFQSGADLTGLKLLQTRTFSSGVVALEYQYA